MLTCANVFLPIDTAKVVQKSEKRKFPNLFQRVTHLTALSLKTFCLQSMLNNENFVSSQKIYLSFN